jgi:hypothetical protein
MKCFRASRKKSHKSSSVVLKQERVFQVKPAAVSVDTRIAAEAIFPRGFFALYLERLRDANEWRGGL